MNHDDFMAIAIGLAKQCKPVEPKRTPKLGVLITRDDAIIAMAHRGTGIKDDDAHAEVIACGQIPPGQVVGTTVYTTLEPCTHHTRRTTSESCTDLLIRRRVAKVVIGILDPNQAVCGRGYNQLQEAGIEVVMFPHPLALEVRAGNAEFIRAQQTYSPKFPKPGHKEVITLKARPHGGYYTQVPVEFECNLPPDSSIFLMVQDHNKWWPQPWGVSRKQGTDLYSGSVGLGTPGLRVIHIVKGNAFGKAVLDFHKSVIERNERREEFLRERLKGVKLPDDLWSSMPSNYHSLHFNDLPNGLDSLASVAVGVRLPSE